MECSGTADESIQLYKELLETTTPYLKKFLRNFPLHKTQLSFTPFNEICYKEIYERLRRIGRIISRKELIQNIPSLKDVCSDCWSFFLQPRTNSVKFMDIKFGKKFEEAFMMFLKKKNIMCSWGDKIKKNHPDIVILDKYSNPVSYIELKYIAAPFLTVYKRIKGRECYEGSLTLDVGEKLKEQRKLVENEIKVPVFYVYWADFPCIKGIFFMPARKVYSYVDEVGIEHVRRRRSGNMIHIGGRTFEIGHREKVYLPLLEMGDFRTLMRTLFSLTMGDKNV